MASRGIARRVHLLNDDFSTLVVLNCCYLISTVALLELVLRGCILSSRLLDISSALILSAMVPRGRKPRTFGVGTLKLSGKQWTLQTIMSTLCQWRITLQWRIEHILFNYT